MLTRLQRTVTERVCRGYAKRLEFMRGTEIVIEWLIRRNKLPRGVASFQK